jgi:CRISPR-associated protein Csb2
MLAVTVTLLHGSIRAASPDDLALAGGDDPGDWPPSPARLVAAFVAADGTRERCRVTTGAELVLFERAAPPRILASPRSEVLATRVPHRYVVANVHDTGGVQEYPARKSTMVRPGTRLFPADPCVAYIWEDVEPDEVQLAALARRAARIGYLGCADSPVRVTLATRLDEAESTRPVWHPDTSGDTDIPVPFDGMIDVLDAAYDTFTAGVLTRRAWFRTELARYRDPSHQKATAFARRWPHTIWLRFGRSLSGRQSLAVAGALKAAILQLYDAGRGDAVTAAPPVLHGHGFGDVGYQLAQWIPLPDVGYSYSRGRVHGAAIMLPAETDPSVLEYVRSAAWRLRHLHLPGGERVSVEPTGDDERPWAASPRRWSSHARRWISVLPAVEERRRHGGPTLEDVTAWCTHAGFPSPVSARVSRVPLLPGSPALRPHEVFRSERADPRPYWWLDVVFPERVPGPMVIGRARQYGMGLMAPHDRQP